MHRAERDHRRAEAAERRARLESILTDLASPDERCRALAVRALCPCESNWPRAAYEWILAACDDPSPEVRLQALHVLEDTPSPPDPRLMRTLRLARNDPDPRVADAATRYLQERRTRERRARQGRYLSPEAAERRKREHEALLYEPPVPEASIRGTDWDSDSPFSGPCASCSCENGDEPRR
jgi:hypothetical protein